MQNNSIIIILVFIIGLTAGYLLNSLTTTTPRLTNGDIFLDDEATFATAQIATNTLQNDNCQALLDSGQLIPTNIPSRQTWQNDNTDVVNTQQARSQKKFSQAVAALSAEQYQDALAAALLNTDPSQKHKKIADLLASWSAQDLTAAYQWLSEQTYTPELDEHYFALTSQYMAVDLTIAGDIIASLPKGQNKRSLSDEYLDQLSAQDPHQAISWVNDIAQTEEREQLQQQVMHIWLETAPERVLDYLSTSADLPQYMQQEIATRAASTLSRSDPEMVANNLVLYPEMLQPQIVYGIIENWSVQAPNEAKDWLNTLPAGTTKDKAIESYIDYAEINPTNNFVLASSLNNKATRLALMSQAFQHWFITAPNEAQNALNNNDTLTAVEKATLLNKVNSD